MMRWVKKKIMTCKWSITAYIYHHIQSSYLKGESWIIQINKSFMGCSKISCWKAIIEVAVLNFSWPYKISIFFYIWRVWTIYFYRKVKYLHLQWNRFNRTLSGLRLTPQWRLCRSKDIVNILWYDLLLCLTVYT